jgi:predicted SAM-dependent methyltransferase
VPRWFESIEVLADEPPFSQALVEELQVHGLNTGCGRVLQPGWLNTDQIRIAERDGQAVEPGQLARVDDGYYLRHDSTQPYPFKDGCFLTVYSEHFIEHLTLEEGTAWFAEVRRVLRPGGLIRVSTPSLARYLTGYVDPDDPFCDENREVLANTRFFKDQEVPARRGWMVNTIFYRWGHRWIYDFGELEHALVEAGFDPATIVERRYAEGEVSEVAALDLPGRARESIYVEARTPT